MLSHLNEDANGQYRNLHHITQKRDPQSVIDNSKIFAPLEFQNARGNPKHATETDNRHTTHAE